MSASSSRSCFCYCFPQDVLIPGSWELGWMKTKREVVHRSMGHACAENTRIYRSQFGRRMHREHHPAPRLKIPLNWIGCPQQRQRNTELTKQAAYTHSSQTQSKAKFLVSCFMIPPLVAAHITILYLLLKISTQAAEYCTPEGHQLILGMT